MATTSTNTTAPEERRLPKPGPRSAVVERRFSGKPLDGRFKTLEEINAYITDTYGSGKTESEQEFIDALNKRGDFSLRLLIIYIFTLWYITTVFLNRFIILADTAFIVRCKIPPLEKCFDFRQVLDISVKDNQRTLKYPRTTEYCAYDVRNYSALITRYGCDYDSIIREINKTEARETQPCEEFVLIKENMSILIHNVITSPTSIRQYFELFCDNHFWHRIFRLSLTSGRIFFTVLFMAAADLYGRKKFFMVGSSLHVLGCLMIFLPEKWYVATGIFLTGVDKSTTFALYALEKCSTSRVLVMGVLIFVIYPIAYIFSFILHYTTLNWMYIHMSTTAMLLVLPFGMWYLNESPKWLMFTGNKREAWKVLKELESDVQPSESALQTSLLSKPSFKKILQFYRKPLFRKRILTCLVLFFLHSISSFTEDQAFALDIHEGTAEFYIISCAFQVFVMAFGYSSAIKYGRRKVMFTFYCISTCLHTLIFMENQYIHSPPTLFFVLQGIQSLKTTVYYIFVLYTSELFPTPYRVTALNICATSRMFGFLIQVNLYQIFHPNSREVRHMPIFITSVICMFIVYFLPKTKNEGLPDTPREAVYLPLPR